MPRVQLCLSFHIIKVVAESQGIERIKKILSLMSLNTLIIIGCINY